MLAGNAATDGQVNIDQRNGKLVNIEDNVYCEANYNLFANLLGDKRQSAVVGSLINRRKWSTPCSDTERASIV